jgi:hypothetical protein
MPGEPTAVTERLFRLAIEVLANVDHHRAGRRSPPTAPDRSPDARLGSAPTVGPEPAIGAIAAMRRAGAGFANRAR